MVSVVGQSFLDRIIMTQIKICVKRANIYVLVNGGHEGTEQQKSQGIGQHTDASPSSSQPPTAGQSDLLVFLKDL